MSCTHDEFHPDDDHICLYCVFAKQEELVREHAAAEYEWQGREQALVVERDEARRERDEVVALLRKALNVEAATAEEVDDLEMQMRASLARIDARKEKP